MDVFAVMALCAVALTAGAQSPAKSYRIGVLSQGNPPTNEVPGSDYRQGLKDWGYVVGRNVAIDFRYAGGNTQKVSELADELVRMKVDVIVTVGESAAFAAKNATASIPVVATEFGVDPVKSGLVPSLGRPTGNVTGLSTVSDELWSKRLGLLRDLVPRLSRIVVFWSPGNNGACLEELLAAGKAMKMTVQPIGISDANSVERAFAQIAKDNPDALALCGDSTTLEYAHGIADFGLRRRLPIIAPLREYVKAGALVSLGTSLSAHRRKAAYYTDKLMKGVKPADLPVEQAQQFEMVVNVTTAKALGIAVPPILLAVVDEVLE